MIDFFLRVFFLLVLSVLWQPVCAQSVSGDAGKVVSSQKYRKVSGEEVRLREDKKEKEKAEKKKKTKSVKGKKKSKSKVKTKAKKKGSSSVKRGGAKVDSLVYEPVRHSLGDRVIMLGDSGRDVRSVARILVKKLYMTEDSIIYTQDGGVRYEGDMVRAIKHFQEFNGFYPDGIIGHDLIKALRKKKN